MTKVLFVLLEGERGDSISFSYKENGEIISLKFIDGHIYTLPDSIIDTVNDMSYYDYAISKRVYKYHMYKIKQQAARPLDEAQEIIDDPSGVTYGLRACRAIEKIIEHLKAKDANG